MGFGEGNVKVSQSVTELGGGDAKVVEESGVGWAAASIPWLCFFEPNARFIATVRGKHARAAPGRCATIGGPR
jgi:hypothetical protein